MFKFPTERILLDTIDLSRRLLEIADRGEATAAEDRCRIFFTTLRDSAYKIQKAAKEEWVAHSEGKRKRDVLKRE